MQSYKKPKIIYIMGCGRSGTTILGYILGNGEKACDLGELIDFIKREGQPNGFGLETENGQFWHTIRQRMKGDIGVIFSYD